MAKEKKKVEVEVEVIAKPFNKKRLLGWGGLILLLTLDRYFNVFDEHLPDNWYAVIFSVLVGLDDKLKEVFKK